MTEKLYYKDAYISEFIATVLSVTAVEGGIDIVLDKTAFFPEEGGQSSDTGYIGDAMVTQVYECDGVVHHITNKTLSLGETKCSVDFADRFEKMQCHTAEHILCGIIHRLFGLDNVGFHLGADEVTFDVNGVLDRAQLDKVEEMANNVVFSNLQIKTLFPMAEELSSIDYRDTTTRNAINDVLTQASQNYYKDSAQILRRNHRIFSQIPRFNKVVIMGLSCGSQDEIYVEEIIKYASAIDFYYYGDDAKENFDAILGNSNVIVKYYKW